MVEISEERSVIVLAITVLSTGGEATARVTVLAIVCLMICGEIGGVGYRNYFIKMRKIVVTLV